MFCKNKLTCRTSFPSNSPKEIPAIKFVGVEGHEEQGDNSPSFYNTHEATEVARQVGVGVCVCRREGGKESLQSMYMYMHINVCIHEGPVTCQKWSFHG